MHDVNLFQANNNLFSFIALSVIDAEYIIVLSLFRTNSFCQVSWVMSAEVARFGMHVSLCTHLIPDVCSCHALRILAIVVCRIGDD